MDPKTINFGLVCPHCRELLTFKKIVDVSHPSPWVTFFYTEDDHQLTYHGPNLEAVSCLLAQEAESEPEPDIDADERRYWETHHVGWTDDDRPYIADPRDPSPSEIDYRRARAGLEEIGPFCPGCGGPLTHGDQLHCDQCDQIWDSPADVLAVEA